MVNLIASWQSNYYQTAYQMVTVHFNMKPLFWTPGSAYLAKTCHNHCVYIYVCYHMIHFSRCSQN